MAHPIVDSIATLLRKTLLTAGILTVAAAALVATPRAADAQYSFDTHDAFVSWALDNNFNSFFYGEMRWGHNFTLTKDWELGLAESGGELLDSAELVWGEAPKDFSFAYNPTPPESAVLDVDGTSVSSNVSEFITQPVSTILIRARATVETNASAFMSFAIRLMTGELLFSSAISGDDDANYFVFDDLRLANGFEVVGLVDLDDPTAASNYGNDPEIQIKVGTTTPEPGTIFLMATGLLGLAWAARRRNVLEA